MSKSEKQDYERIQLLATPEIMSWWREHKDDPNRQENLREIIREGMSIVSGEYQKFKSDRARILEAIDVLLESGRLTDISGLLAKATPEPMPVDGPKKPNIGKLKKSISENMR